MSTAVPSSHKFIITIIMANKSTDRHCLTCMS